jgi:hypothetical protein
MQLPWAKDEDSVVASRGGLRAWVPGMLMAGALLAIWAVSYPYYSQFGKQDDPDYFFHLALGREFAHGIVRQMPQVEDLGWASYFPDKDFLFHWILGRLHSYGGIPAQETLPILIGLGWWAFWVAVGLRSPQALVAVALFGIGGIYLAPSFFVRFQTLRPLVLSTLAAMVMIVGVMRGRRWVAAIAGGCFALTYSAFFVPAALALSLLVAAGPDAIRDWRRRPETFALGALLVASVVHPYFPSNYVAAWVTWSIGTATAGLMDTIRSGGELRPLAWRDFFTNYSWALSAFGLSAALLLKERPWRREDGRQDLCLLAWAVMFWLYSAKSHRAMEYAIPLTGLLFAGQLAKLHVRPALLAAIGAATVAAQAALVLFGPPLLVEPAHLADHTFHAIEALDQAPAGSKVFNCEWGAGAYLIFARPDLRLVDVFDSYLLYAVNPKKAMLKVALREGRAKDPIGAIRTVFKSDYVLCSERALLRQLAAIPSVRWLTPFDGTTITVPAVAELPH